MKHQFDKKVTEEELCFASSIWDFLSCNDPIQKADLIFVPCSHDLRIAAYAAELYRIGFAEYILFSGGLNFFTKHIFSKSEALAFSNHIISLGIPKESIIIEDKSTNTGENILFSKKMLSSMNLHVPNVIAIQKPSMTLRLKLALAKQWNEACFYISSPNYKLLEAPHSHINLFLIINEIVGDLQRIMEYPKLGFQVKTQIPESIEIAFQYLVSKGYDLHLLKSF
ncbi:YdcF family protein [Leptospira kemamanensis]|uniref:YdcF family protein n=1 Tax=Leptospira kemamanensis TaxID=2484942 RepID=A0A4R9JS81_9LEPT|nr:YdcF family protein [Leptospira kemamanensis]TGL55541.1 YdcF family protein [Leptospira kemamanensis]